jgi:hypothetical protein
VHISEIELADALPVQVWGPSRLMLPFALTSPSKPSNGGANDNEQSLWLTTAVMPTSEASQCFATFQLPETSGHAPLVFPPPDPEPPSDEPELHAHAKANARNARLPIFRT